MTTVSNLTRNAWHSDRESRFPRHAIFPAVANTQSFQPSIGVSVMAERRAM